MASSVRASRSRAHPAVDGGFARVAAGKIHIYLVGDTTAVLLGWRATTIDVDFVMRPEDDAFLRAIPELKEALEVNVEMASPADFIPVPPGWEDRSTFVEQIARVAFFHLDLDAQALAKVERGHVQDLADVRELVGRKLVDPQRALDYFARMEPELYRFPAIDAPSFRRAVEEPFGPAHR